MLKGLPDVDWNRLQHAYGAAEDLPALIFGLTSDDPELWVTAMDGLYQTICHQGSVYPATAPAIPFLLELLNHQKIRCRGSILQFLGETARTRSSWAARAEFSFYAEQKNSESFQAKLAEELESIKKTREAIWNGFDQYLELMNSPSPQIRVMVPYTLTQLTLNGNAEIPEDLRNHSPRQLIIQRLNEQLAEEPHDLVRATLIFALGRIAAQEPGLVPSLEACFNNPSSSPAVRFSAAICLSDLAPALSESVLELFLDAYQNKKATDRLFKAHEHHIEDKHHPLAKAYRGLGSPLSESSGTGFDAQDVGREEDFKFPWLDSIPSGMVFKRLTTKGALYCDRILPLMTHRVDQASSTGVDMYLEPILNLVFDGQKASALMMDAGFSDSQRDLLQRIYDNPRLWATNIANAASLLKRFGLPDDRELFAKMIGAADQNLSTEKIKHDLALIAEDQNPRHRGPKIRRLILRKFGTVEFLPHLKDFADLEYLDLSGMTLSDGDLNHLHSLPNLKHLELVGTPITDAGIEILVRLSTIEHLNLSGTRISDRGLAKLSQLPHLTSVRIVNVSVSDDAVSNFRIVRPNCKLLQTPF